ncbi:hypothetical protein AL073_09290 [Loktanella sp. 1ANDIMAR09]|nr:hypothetical protein AL073_09290 [Loktanella sp. 1ANDIMAR09]
MLTTYKIAIRFLREHFAMFLSLAVLLWIAEIFISYAETSGSVVFVMWAIAAYYLHRATMFDEASVWKAPKNPVRPAAIGRFIMLSFLISVILVAGVIIVIFAQGFDEFVEKANAGTNASLIGILAIAIALNVLLLVLFGTALPAAAAADKFGLLTTLRRSRQTWQKTLSYLIFGPGLFWAIYVPLLLILNAQFHVLGAYFDLQGNLDVVQTAVGLPLKLMELFGTLLGVIALSRAYAHVASDDVKAVMVGELKPV